MESILFVAKKLAAWLLFPVGLVLALGAAGFILWRGRPGRRLGPTLLIVAWALLAALSMPVVGGLLLAPLESDAGDYADPAALKTAGVTDVVVLSGSHRPGPLSPADALGSSTSLRLLEGLRLWRGLGPEARLVLSGGGFADGGSAAAPMGELAVRLGVPREAMVLEEKSWDTKDQAVALRSLLDGRPFALVTSASHLPRALMIFRNHGLRPLPAPADFLSRSPGAGLFAWLPQGQGLANSERALYEYIGLAWTWLIGPPETPRPLPSSRTAGK